jgi:hypothetical protein
MILTLFLIVLSLGLFVVVILCGLAILYGANFNTFKVPRPRLPRW